MLDSSGDGHVTQQEFLAAAKASLAAAKKLQAERAAGGTGSASSDMQVRRGLQEGEEGGVWRRGAAAGLPCSCF
jgi:hypothetical protein